MKRETLKIGILTAAILLTAVAGGITAARLQSRTEPLINTFDPGSITTVIEEEGSGEMKKSRIRNVGENDCLVRARVTISPAEAASAILLTGKGEQWNWSEWADGDGYVYYEGVLPAGENSFTGFLFEEVKLKDGIAWKSLGIENFDITVYEEAVQTQAYDTVTGKMYSALDEDGSYDAEKASDVWAIYETAEK